MPPRGSRVLVSLEEEILHSSVSLNYRAVIRGTNPEQERLVMEPSTFYLNLNLMPNQKTGLGWGRGGGGLGAGAGWGRGGFLDLFICCSSKHGCTKHSCFICFLF